MLYDLLKLVHVLSIVVWVGGMAFAHCFLRPALAELEPPARQRLMHGVLARFLRAVMAAAVLTLVTGLWMIGNVARHSGGAFSMPLGWTVMATLGIVMIAIYGHVRFAMFRRLSRAVDAAAWAQGGQALAGIRRWVGVNLILGLLTVAAAILL